MGSVAKSYMRKGFLIYEDMRSKYLGTYEKAVSLILLCNRSRLNFLMYEEKCKFLSVFRNSRYVLLSSMTVSYSP